ncbi:MAG: NAD(P)/FAD-dependent oxidoreductase [Spirochaetota bacterium]
MPEKKHVVVVGDGFAGLQAVKKLAKRKVDLQITTIDKTNHHLFQPLLYQVASAVLSPADIAIPTRSITTNWKNVSVFMGKVEDIDTAKKLLYYQDREIAYDYLILAMGARTSYFGNDHWAKHTTGLKSIKDALQIRRQLLLSFERAELESTSREKMSEHLNYVIIGGGPTGVELAGSIAELSKRIIREDFRRVDPGLNTITLVEAGPRLLPMLSEKSSEIARKALEKRGVTVMLDSRVTNIDETGVHLADRIITSKNIVWAAGVAANPFAEKLGVELDRSGRVVVDEFCAVPGHPEIFVIGDMANFSKGYNAPLPGVSPTAMQQGRYVASIIIDELKGKQRSKPFRYVDKGAMATIGRMDAVAEVGKLRLSGFLGWLAWLTVHLFYQVGFKNKVSILITWIWSYISFKAGARLIQDSINEEEVAK